MMRAVKLTSVAVVLFGFAAYVAAEEASGTIKTVDKTRKEVVLKGVVKDTAYELDKDATIWLDGARCKLSDLAPDDRAVIDFQKKGDHMIASMVRGLRKAQETRGTVNDILNDKNEVTLKGTIKNSTYELDKVGTVFINGKRSSLKDIRPGDEVLVTYERRGDHMVAHDVTVTKRK